MMKNSLAIAALSVLITGVSFAMGAPNRPAADLSECASDMTPGGIRKKYVGLLFDVMQTMPSNIVANADQFAKHAPYLDGVAVGLNNIPVINADGSVSTTTYHYIMHPTQRWTREAIKDQLPYLKKIAKTPHLTESLLLFWLTPAGRGNRIDWDNDEGWANFAENMANVAWLAKEAGLKGLMVDPEEYGAQGGQLAQYIHSWKDPPFPETARLARQRGREVFSRVFKEFPDAVIWSLWCFNKFGYWMDEGRQPYPRENIDQSGELLHYFLNGMLDVLPPAARVVEGAEHYSGSALNHAYTYDLVKAATTSLALVAPENVAKYRSQVYFGNTHYLDMYKMDGNPRALFYHGPVDGSRLEHMRLNFEQSLRVATEYVWIYGEHSGKLFNWRNGHFAKQKTWEEVAPGMTETIMLVKNPLGFAAQRKAALKKEGKLVNLAEDLEAVKFEPTSEAREFRYKKEKVYSAKNLKPGEKYHVRVNVIERGVEEGSFLEGVAKVFAFWRKDGKRTSAKPMEIPLHYDQGRNNRGAVPAMLTVTVPEGADELEFDFCSTIKLGERVCYWSLEMHDLRDPENPPESAHNGRWTFDEKKKTLTNGHWMLSASLDRQKRGGIVVRGDNEKTVGSGVLDLTSVKKDTGYFVTRVGKLKNLPSLTAVYAPDAIGAVDGGLRGSTNVTAIVVGEVSPARWAKTPGQIRISRLENLGFKDRVKTNFKIFDHRHNLVYRVQPEKDLSVKGVKPGELYSVGLSMKRRGPGYVFLYARFRGNGEEVKPKEHFPAIAMRGERKEDAWQSGEIVVRVPEGADEIYFDISAEVTEGYTSVEIDDFKVYKIGDPLPVWPPETVREKEWK